MGHARYLRLIFLCLTLALCAATQALWVPLAHANEPSAADRATARTLAQEGYVALREKDYATAADRFSRALALVQAPTLLRDLARAQVGLGKLVDAHENYSLIIRQGIPANAPAPWVQALADAKAEIAAIPPRLPWVTITVTGPSDPTVTIDGVPIASASLGVKRPADPGRHEIRASAPGYYAAKKLVTLQEGESVHIALELEEAPPEAPPPAPEPVVAAPVEPPAEPGWRKPSIIAAFAVGGAGLALGGVTGILAINKHKQLSKDCPTGVCGPPHEAAVSNYHTLGRLSTIGFIVGGVGAATGVVLLLVKPQASSATASDSTKSDRRSTLRLSPFVGVASAGVEGTF